MSFSAATIRQHLLRNGLEIRVCLHRIPLTQNYRLLLIQWACLHDQWHANLQHLIFSVESRFNLGYRECRTRLWQWIVKCHLPKCVIQAHTGRTLHLIVWGPLSVMDNYSSCYYEQQPLTQTCAGAFNAYLVLYFKITMLARPFIVRNGKNVFSAQHIHLICWSAINWICRFLQMLLTPQLLSTIELHDIFRRPFDVLL